MSIIPGCHRRPLLDLDLHALENFLLDKSFCQSLFCQYQGTIQILADKFQRLQPTAFSLTPPLVCKLSPFERFRYLAA